MRPLATNCATHGRKGRRHDRDELISGNCPDRNDECAGHQDDQDGSGNAALTSKRLPDRIPRRIRNLVVASVLGALVAVGAAQLFFRSPSAPGWVAGSTEQEMHPSPSPTSVATTIPLVTGTPTPTEAPALREYALAISELHGLPPDVQPGQQLELWVAWDPEFSEGPQIQRLLKTVTLTRFVEPVTADGPRVVILSVPEKRVGDLMYGDRFGSLSVTLGTG